jgi:predicted phage-related endonuclease
LQDANDEIKRAEELRDDAKALLMAALGSATAGEIPGSKHGYTLKAQKRRTIDSKRLRKEFPKVAEEVTNVSTCRVLRRVKSLS